VICSLKIRDCADWTIFFPDMDIAVGDTIETSGLGGIYPKGIIIGKVRKSDVNQ